MCELNSTYKYNEDEGPPPLVLFGGGLLGPIGGPSVDDGIADEVVVVEDMGVVKRRDQSTDSSSKLSVIVSVSQRQAVCLNCCVIPFFREKSTFHCM